MVNALVLSEIDERLSLKVVMAKRFDPDWCAGELAFRFSEGWLESGRLESVPKYGSMGMR